MILWKGAALLAPLALATSLAAAAPTAAPPAPALAPKGMPVTVPPAPPNIAISLPFPAPPRDPSDVHAFRPTFVPLVALPLQSGIAWFKGPMPSPPVNPSSN